VISTRAAVKNEDIINAENGRMPGTLLHSQSLSLYLHLPFMFQPRRLLQTATRQHLLAALPTF